MIKIINKIKKGASKLFVLTIPAALFSSVLLTTSCQDFFDMESDRVIYADKSHINTPTDTLNYYIGILNKMQAIADRTILLGEARGDLVDITSTTPADLRNVALFDVDEDNSYNSPKDYYAIINNCNAYLDKVKVDLQNNRHEYVFQKEYAAIKAIRAWTYLQLVTTYGKVPFVTEPILTKEDGEKEYPLYDIKQICDYFLHHDGLDELVEDQYPFYGNIKGVPSNMFVVPLRLILGDLALWNGEYLAAARYYYNYLESPTNHRATTLTSTEWNTADGTSKNDISYLILFSNETANSEIISIIPGDSIKSEGYYSQLRNTFNSTYDNDYLPSLVPSQNLFNLSESQAYNFFDGNGYKILPATFPDHQSGDLRLSAVWSNNFQITNSKNQKVDYVSNYKYSTRNIHVYRRILVYLRLAEALNRAGYPRFAYQILARGLNNRTIENYVLPYHPDDEDVLASFDFSNVEYYVRNPKSPNNLQNMMGIHSRGSGYAAENPKYLLPLRDDIVIGENAVDSLDSVRIQLEYQIDEVEKMIVDEEALEFAFEGYRFYDLVRIGLRRDDPKFVADKVYARKGVGTDSGIKADLLDVKNWFLKWGNNVGLFK